MKDPEIFIKKITYKLMHRGCKEMDILLEKTIPFMKKMTHEEHRVYDRFLNEEDHDIFDWILKRKNFPSHYALPFIENMFANIIPPSKK